ncbi:hypothetical protein Salat_1483200 [Sesamum alatum]|uniref:Uncharacterized protein n=1 Tax=Sesamum alatum TaxID=300844 RepID=A0AAE2CM27_9LAMI|nr:hypothetical protein Salat_1483200 [Sesamum alatum]
MDPDPIKIKRLRAKMKLWVTLMAKTYQDLTKILMSIVLGKERNRAPHTREPLHYITLFRTFEELGENEQGCSMIAPIITAADCAAVKENKHNKRRRDVLMQFSLRLNLKCYEPIPEGNPMNGYLSTNLGQAQSHESLRFKVK